MPPLQLREVEALVHHAGLVRVSGLHKIACLGTGTLAPNVPAMTLDPQSVNLDLETSVLFEPKDVTSNTSFLNHVKSFLNDLQQVLDPDTRLRAREDSPKFTEILEDLGRTLLNFSDNDITSLTKNLYGKVKKLKVNDNDGYLRKNLKHTAKSLLKKWTKTEPTEIRAYIRSYLENERGYFVDYVINKLNLLFKEKDIEKIKIKLDKSMRNNNHKELTKVLGNIINHLFDQQNNNLKSDDDKDGDVITAGRLESNGNIDGDELQRKLDLKRRSKEVILNKNIEVFVRAAE